MSISENKARGFFAMGVEGITKPANLGNLARSSHAFGASFFYTISPVVDVHGMQKTDTSDAFDHLPFYNFDTVGELSLPKKCALVAIELTPDSVELPSFRHPMRAAYVLGQERGNVSDELMERADHVIKIPMKFCVNVGVAGAIVMYDRLLSMGKFRPRPVKAGGPTEFLPEHTHGNQIIRSGRKEN